MTDQMPTRHQNFLSIMDKLGGLPQNVDHNGKSRDEKARTTEGINELLESSPYAHLDEEPPAPQEVGMKPNRAQGHGGSPVPTQHQGSPLERIRAAMADRRDSVFDGGGAA